MYTDSCWKFFCSIYYFVNGYIFIVLGKEEERGSNQEISIGDRVIVSVASDALKELQEGHGGWNHRMAEVTFRWLSALFIQCRVLSGLSVNYQDWAFWITECYWITSSESVDFHGDFHSQLSYNAVLLQRCFHPTVSLKFFPRTQWMTLVTRYCKRF